MTDQRHSKPVGWVLGLAACAFFVLPAASAAAVQFFHRDAAITAGDPDQTSRLARDGVAETCAAPDPESTAGAGTYNYDAYSFLNRTITDLCITVELSSTCLDLFSAAYIPTFDPLDVTTNKVADAGFSSDAGTSYAFVVSGRTPFVVNVHETESGVGCPSYTIATSSDKPWARSLPKISDTTPTVGQRLTATTGSWAGLPTITQRWRRCRRRVHRDPARDPDEVHPDGLADVGFELELQVTATDGGGSSKARSAMTDPVAP